MVPEWGNLIVVTSDNFLFDYQVEKANGGK
jgi:hypothetical protein